MNKLFSYHKRAVHLGPYPTEHLCRRTQPPDYHALAPMQPLRFCAPELPLNIINAMDEYQATLDCLRDGAIQSEVASIPSDPLIRSQHLKAFGYFCDASHMGVGRISSTLWLEQSITNPGVANLADKLASTQVRSFASGIDQVLAMVRKAANKSLAPCQHHQFAVVILYEFPRDPGLQEKGCDWLHGAQQHRAALRAAETANVLANYIRCLGFEARAHSEACSDIDLPKLALASGLTSIEHGQNTNPFVGTRFGLAAVTTTLSLHTDDFLAQPTLKPIHRLIGSLLNTHTPQRKPSRAYAKRAFKDGAYAFETIKRVPEPTTYIDATSVPRVPKRADMFARALFGDMGNKNQAAAKNGQYVRKSPSAFAFRSALGALSVLQGDAKTVENTPAADLYCDPKTNADLIKATAYWLGCDAVGISACPDWAYYSHNAAGDAILPYHRNGISIVIDQGHETMEGASGDDWISCAQSMRSYLRFSLLGGVLAAQIRRLGYSAKVHTVINADVIQPPLTLLSGLGEVSRIGEVILNPMLGPRLKSGTITTNLPLAHDLPIDFGLQAFCEHCNKCARECPSGAITAGPKKMFNGYEIWKSDSQKCLTYRITTEGGAMCGRCMKTCPWNLEGIWQERPFRFVAKHLPKYAKLWAAIDDRFGHGQINTTKKWWWDLEARGDGAYKIPLKPVNTRPLQTDLAIDASTQTLAVYPANLLPPPYPYPAPIDREAGIAAHDAMVCAKTYRQHNGEAPVPQHRYPYAKAHMGAHDSPVIQVVISELEVMSDTCTRYRLAHVNGEPLPQVTAGAHIDVLVAPEYLRPYSLASNPEQRQYYDIVVQREDDGRGGSRLMHQVFEIGRKVFIGKPNNHFPLREDADFTYLMGGGIGITPMLAMAHRLHQLGQPFALHYSSSQAAQAAFTKSLQVVPWAENAHIHLSDQGTRADFSQLLLHQGNAHVYACGPDVYMQAIMNAATSNGFAQNQCHIEYFSPPSSPEFENHPFTLIVKSSQQRIIVSPEQSAADALADAGILVPLKCDDGICGVCQCTILEGDVEHRDFVLSNEQRQTQMILCQSRSRAANGVIIVDL